MSFKTGDLYQSAFFRAKGARLIDVKTAEYGKLIFEFEDSENINTLVKEFCNNGTVNVQDFISAIRTLKGLIANPYNHKRG
jgi:hypothetical protein